MYLVLDSIPFRRVPPAPLCCNCNAASLWHRVCCCCCCMSAPFSMLCRLAAAVVCVFFFPPRFLLGAQHVFRLEKITNPIVCATFSTVLARFLPLPLASFHPLCLFLLSASYLFLCGTNLGNAFCCCSSGALCTQRESGGMVPENFIELLSRKLSYSISLKYDCFLYLKPFMVSTVLRYMNYFFFLRCSFSLASFFFWLLPRSANELSFGKSFPSERANCMLCELMAFRCGFAWCGGGENGC